MEQIYIAKCPVVTVWGLKCTYIGQKYVANVKRSKENTGRPLLFAESAIIKPVS